MNLDTLKTYDLKYCKVRRKDKRPFENDWTNKPYSYTDIKPWVELGNNYGVICGYGGLVVVDADEPEVVEHIERGALPPTFTVKTSKGYHYYYFCKELLKKIILQNGKHYGEVQSWGTQVVGPGSLHPNGGTYKQLNTLPIQTISEVDLLAGLRPFLPIEKAYTQAETELKNYADSDINNVKITSVISLSKSRSVGNGEMLGENPWHGSTNGGNMAINASKNLAHCFRCNTGMNVAQVIAREHGIISECGGHLSKEQFVSVLKIAQDKYGLKKPEPKMARNRVSVSGLKITSYQDNVLIFHETQPFFYDKSGLFWFWSNEDKKYEIVDEVDIMIAIDNQLGFGGETVTSGVKNGYMESFKRVGRMNVPEVPPKTWVQFKDRIVDVMKGTEHEATPKYFFTNPIPHNVGSSDETPTLDKIFTEWVGSDYVQTLYQIIAYSMLTDYPIHRLFCFIGSGMNGKSKYLELITRVVGTHNTTTTDLDVLMKSKFETTRLHKKLICLMGETNFNEMNKTSLLKRLTGQDLIGFEYKNKRLFEDYNYAKIYIATNNLPATSDKTDGFYRRWMIIDFPNKFSEKKDILGDIPDAEYEQLCCKCISILRDLISNRSFHNEGSIEQRKKLYEDKSNPFQKFWDDNIGEDYDGHISKRDFKIKVDGWCRENGYRQMGERTISTFMKEKGVEDSRITAEWFTADGTKPRYMAWIGVRWL